MYSTMKSIIDDAHKNGYAVPAINCINMEMVRGAISAASEEHAAVIVNMGCGQMLNHAHPSEMVPMIKELAQSVSVPVSLNLDHGAKYDDVIRCIGYGFSNIMIDASDQDFEENIKRTELVCVLAHAQNISVEGELGHVGVASNDDHEKLDLYTKPKQAKEFVDRTGVDALAIAIGTAHGNYPHHLIPKLDFDRLEEIRNLLDTPLVLHGGSGCGDENLRKAAHSGINKINICTDAFQTCKDAFLSTVKDQPDLDYMHICMEMEKKMKAFTIH